MRGYIHLLVVGVVVGVLASLLLASVGRVGSAANRMLCASNARQIAIATHNYCNDFNYFPQATMPNDKLPPEKRLSWLVAMMPYMEANNLYKSFDRAQAWDAEENRKIALIIYRMFQCPASPDRSSLSTLPFSDYIGITGVGFHAATYPVDDPRAGIFGYDRILKFDMIKDGKSTTLLLAETQTDCGPWVAGGYATARGLDPVHTRYLGKGRQFSSLHYHSSAGLTPQYGTNVAFADCSSRFLAPSIDRRIFTALATYAGGEDVEPLPEE